MMFEEYLGKSTLDKIRELASDDDELTPKFTGTFHGTIISLDSPVCITYPDAHIEYNTDAESRRFTGAPFSKMVIGDPVEVTAKIGDWGHTESEWRETSRRWNGIAWVLSQEFTQESE